ncbi:MAG: hypothetical protein IT245_06760 [Bacteroidia bacterium]|nr:hypothetical protein [Bacteroidia bacterium]
MKRRNFVLGLFAIPAVAKALAKMPNSFAVSDYNPFKVHRTTDPFPTTIVGKEEFDYPMHLAQVDNNLNLPCYSDADCPPGHKCVFHDPDSPIGECVPCEWTEAKLPKCGESIMHDMKYNPKTNSMEKIWQ